MRSQRIENGLVAPYSREFDRIVPIEIVHRDGKLWRWFARDGGYATEADGRDAQA